MWLEDWPIVFDQQNGKYGSGDHQRLNTFSTPKTFILSIALTLKIITLNQIKESQSCFLHTVTGTIDPPREKHQVIKLLKGGNVGVWW